MRKQSDAGFTLLEIAVTLMVIGILTAILSPLVTKYIDEARITRAMDESQSIAKAMLNFNKDTGKWPIFTPPAATITTTSAIYTLLVSPGANPQCSVDCASWQSVSRGQISDILERNSPGYGTSGKFAWRGPYITSLGTDPWGNAYLVNAASLGFGLNRAAFVLSAGPNVRVETSFVQNIGSGSAAFSTGGDDIVARVK